MKRDRKILCKSLLAITASLMLGVSMFAGCKKDKPEDSEVEVETYYDPLAGIDFESEITSFVTNGKTDYKIAIPTKASECEKYAAEELRKYIQKSTGATLPIITDASDVSLGQKIVSIGDTKLFRASGLETSNLNTDGFRLKTDGETLLIKGERDRGTLYGVYDFLEKYIGARFLSAEFEHIPAVETITLYKSDVTEIPDFALRTRFANEISMNLAGAARMRLVGPFNAEGAASAKFGGGYKDDFIGTMHAYNSLVDYEVYGELHPEWFATPTNNAGEGDPYPQWCLSNGLTDDGTISNEENTLAKAAIAAVKNRVLGNSTGKYVGFGQNDNRNVCMCDNCERQRALFGGYSGHTVAFTNAVANAVDASLKADGINREMYYVTYAYMYTVDAPNMDAPKSQLAVPNDNVYVQLCPYYDFFNSPLFDMENNFSFADSTTKWSKITDNFLIFDYTMNFSHELLWYPNFSVLKPNIDWYKELGVNGVVSSGSGESYESRLQTYLFSKLQWNSNRDVTALIREFNALYFGTEAGKVMDGFVDFNNAWYEYAATKDGSRQKAGLYSRAWQTSADTLSVEYIRQCQRYIDQAKACIEADKTSTTAMKNAYLKNLMRAELIVDFSKYINYKSLHFTTSDAEERFMRDFYRKLKTFNVSSFGMAWGKDQSVEALFAEMGIS